MDRKQFTFYASFYDGVSRIKDAEARAMAYDAICNYALTGDEPDLNAMPDAAASAFIFAKPNLEASRRKASSGRHGGSQSKPKANASKAKANGKQGRAKQAESKKEKENKKENKCYNPLPPVEDRLCSFSPELRTAVEQWLTYKREKKQDYKPTGLQHLLSEIENNAKIYGDASVAELIRHCMASNWQGIVFDRLKEKPVNPRKSGPIDIHAPGYQASISDTVRRMHTPKDNREG